MASNVYLNYLIVAKEAAFEANKIIKNSFNRDFVTKSSLSDLVTITDQESEKTIKNILKKHFPSHDLIGEESSDVKNPLNLTDNPTWIIDPLDGTTNFIHSFENFSISIALYINKQAIIGIVYNCHTNEIYEAIKGYGSFCNGKKLNVSSNLSLKGSLVITEWGSNRNDNVVESKSQIMKSLINDGGVHGIRCCGSAALNLCQVAKGSSEVYYEWGIYCWDIAAGILILQEAGGVVSLLNGDEMDIFRNQIVATSNSRINQELIPYLSNAILI